MVSVHTNGKSPVFRYWLEIAAIAGVRMVTNYLSVLHGISSGHSALFWLIPFRSLLPPVRSAPR